MLSEVNKVNKDNSICVSFLLYFVPTPLPAYLDPPVYKFFKILEDPPPPFILTPRLFWPPVYYEPESKKCVFAIQYCFIQRYAKKHEPVTTASSAWLPS